MKKLYSSLANEAECAKKSADMDTPFYWCLHIACKQRKIRFENILFVYSL